MDQYSTHFYPGVPGLIPEAWIVKPKDAKVAPPVVAVHGITRGIPEMITHLAPRACSTGRTLVLPHFDTVHWRRYQNAICTNRADWSLLRLMDSLQKAGDVSAGRFDLSGFSGGAQFAHRFAWLYPSHVERLCVTAPGWWTFPDVDVAWPYGAGSDDPHSVQGFRLQANLRRFLDREIIVCVGSQDTTRDKNLRKGVQIDTQQGDTRVARAHRWVDAMTASARKLGLEPRISLRVLHGCGHDFTECVTHGALDQNFVPHTAQCAECNKRCACSARHNLMLSERIAA